LTRQLLAFSRRQVLRPEVTDVNRIVDEARVMLDRLIGGNVAISYELDAGLRAIVVDREQVVQVILNLALNARDAMPEGGRLSIETAPASPSPPSGARAGIRLTVVDTGCGIVPEVRARLFEPFFTTKEVGKGTGLGLATVLGIVTDAGGRVEVESEPLRGSSFHVFLPGANEPPSAPLLRAEMSDADRHGTETVLLVEDDSSVRSLLRDVLTDAGYSILASGSTREAAAVAARHAGNIHLLLCDVVLPGGSGPDLHRTLRLTRPSLPVLYLSGYTDDELQRAGLPENAPLVRKPLSGDELLLAVRASLAPPV
jgi:CheY-like chemotaxis protein